VFLVQQTLRLLFYSQKSKFVIWNHTFGVLIHTYLWFWNLKLQVQSFTYPWFWNFNLKSQSRALINTYLWYLNRKLQYNKCNWGDHRVKKAGPCSRSDLAAIITLDFNSFDLCNELDLSLLFFSTSAQVCEVAGPAAENWASTDKSPSLTARYQFYHFKSCRILIV